MAKGCNTLFYTGGLGSLPNDAFGRPVLTEGERSELCLSNHFKPSQNDF
jgi:hypothetical protein